MPAEFLQNMRSNNNLSKMAHMSFEQYLDQVEKGLVSKNGDILAELFSFRHPHIASTRLQLPDSQMQCEKWFEQPYDEMVASHLRAVWAVANGDYVEAHAAQAVVVQSFTRAFQSQKDENWALPLMNVVTLDLRLFAMQADKQQIKKGQGKPGEMLEKAAEVMMGCFRVCASDSRSSLDVSKKWGMLALVNHLFKIYFKINKLHLCKPLIRAIDSATIKDQFKLAHLVTYRYFVGRKAMFDSDFKAADEYLSFAFQHCNISSSKNKRAILVYLIPVKMLLGYIPKEEILYKYNLTQFVDIVRSVRMGNLALLNETLEGQQAFFIQCGVYLILEKLKIITYRNLFKKVALLLKTHQLPLDAFVIALKTMQVEDIDVIEVECIVANLIYMGYIKGYISHQHQKLVVSKQNPFPALTSFL
ncbi:PCI domain-containing protein 2-like [Orbicella faveolata]|uniref:PCI domain-containing protein 2-like n=1 Tax=Orbicella faveolata TaxID=48498 RepID=UPI0009E60854|nr:PCI domain-containing protein 2-like [Orbicella faveolata]